METGNNLSVDVNDFAIPLSNTLCLLGCSMDIVGLFRELDKHSPKEIAEKLRAYNQGLTDSVKSRLANCTTLTVDVITHKLN